MSPAWVNLTDYTPTEQLLLAVSGVFWSSTYFLILLDARRKAFLGVPVLAVPANLACEFLHGYVYPTNMGALADWGQKIYFPLSCLMGWYALRHGERQFHDETLRRYTLALFAFAAVAWGAFLYFFIPAVDDSAGITTGIIVTLLMSALYPVLLLQRFERAGADGVKQLSYAVAWFKCLGTSFAVVFAFLHLTGRPWVLVLCVVTFLLDLVYLRLFARLRSAVGGAWMHVTPRGSHP